jgi:hypothetical protein
MERYNDEEKTRLNVISLQPVDPIKEGRFMADQIKKALNI